MGPSRGDKMKKVVSTVRTSGEKILGLSRPHVKKVRAASRGMTKRLLEGTSEKVTRQVHRAMGSDEYLEKSGDINKRLLAVLQVLEDSIRRRDAEITRLRMHVTDLENQLKARRT